MTVCWSYDAQTLRIYPSVDAGDVKAALAVLSFILSSAARYNVESAPLSDELQQLGLPKGPSALTMSSPTAGGCSL